MAHRPQTTRTRGTVALVGPASIGETGAMRSHRRPHPCPAPRSAFAGYRFPPEVIALAVRRYLRFGLSYRDVEELLAERGIEVDHVTIYRWVQRFAPEFAEAARARQHVVGDRWHVDETYVKVGGIWHYLFRAIDRFGQVIDVYLSSRRNREAARSFFARAIDRTRISPAEVTTDLYRVYRRVLDELLPAAFHDTEAHANNPIETDHGRLKARLRPMRGLKTHRTARVVVAGHAFIQNVRRGFYDLGTDVPAASRLADAVAELVLAI
jgi:transposase-like protein